MLITAARYDRESGLLSLAQGYEPVGQVWSDIRLFDRQQLIDRIVSGDRVANGRVLPLATDFESQESLSVVGEGDDRRLVVNDQPNASGDDLGVPQF